MAVTAKSRAESIDPEVLKRMAEILKTISHPVRLKVLEILEGAESMTVSELMTHTGIEQSLLSHHLIKMKDKRILTSVRDGKNVKYSLIDSHITKIFDCMQECSLI